MKKIAFTFAALVFSVIAPVGIFYFSFKYQWPEHLSLLLCLVSAALDVILFAYILKLVQREQEPDKKEPVQANYYHVQSELRALRELEKTKQDPCTKHHKCKDHKTLNKNFTLENLSDVADIATILSKKFTVTIFANFNVVHRHEANEIVRNVAVEYFLHATGEQGKGLGPINSRERAVTAIEYAKKALAKHPKNPIAV